MSLIVSNEPMTSEATYTLSWQVASSQKPRTFARLSASTLAQQVAVISEVSDARSLPIQTHGEEAGKAEAKSMRVVLTKTVFLKLPLIVQ